MTLTTPNLLCLPVCVCAHVYRNVHVCVHMESPEGSISCHLPTLSFEITSLIGQKHLKWSRPASHGAPRIYQPVSMSPALGLQACATVPGFFRTLNLSYHFMS